MIGMVVRRFLVVGKSVRVAMTMMVVLGLAVSPARAGLGTRHVDPAQIVPLPQIAAEHREAVAEVIRDHTFHRQGEADAFPCPSSLYLSLVNEPAVTLALWKDLSDVAGPAPEGRAQPIRGDRRVGRVGRLGVRAPLTPHPCPSGVLELCEPPRQRARSRPGSFSIVNTSYYQDSNQDSVGPAQHRRVRQGRLEGMEDGRPAVAAGRRADPGGAGQGSRLFRLADEPPRDHLPELGQPGRQQPSGDRRRDQATLLPRWSPSRGAPAPRRAARSSREMAPKPRRADADEPRFHLASGAQTLRLGLGSQDRSATISGSPGSC